MKLSNKQKEVIEFEEILTPYCFNVEDQAGVKYNAVITAEDAKKAMLEACKKCLRLAADNASNFQSPVYSNGVVIGYEIKIDKQSILNTQQSIKL